MRVTHTTHYLAIYLVSKHEMDATWTGHSPSPSLPEPQGPCVLPEEGMHPGLTLSRPRADHVPSSRRSPLRRGCPPPSRRLRPRPPWLPWLPWLAYLAPPARGGAPHRHLVAALRALLAPLGDNLVNGDLGWVFPLLAELADGHDGHDGNETPQDEFAALARRCHSLRVLGQRKVVFIPDLIPQPDWDKYH